MLRIKLHGFAKEMRIIAVFFAIGMRSAVFHDLPCDDFYKVVVAFSRTSLFAESHESIVFFLFLVV